MALTLEYPFKADDPREGSWQEELHGQLTNSLKSNLNGKPLQTVYKSYFKGWRGGQVAKRTQVQFPTHMAAHNCLTPVPGDLMPPDTASTRKTDTHTGKTPKHIKIRNKQTNRKTTSRLEMCESVVEHLPGMYNIMGCIPGTINKFGHLV